MPEINRRTAVTMGIATVALSSACANASPGSKIKNEIIYQPKPLPFDPSKVTGLSEKLLRSHHERNYSGAVKRLGKIQTQMSQFEFGSGPGFELNGIKREELMALNSICLLYTSPSPRDQRGSRMPSSA